MTDNQTSNTCPNCGKQWLDEIPIPGLLHRTRICAVCWKTTCKLCGIFFLKESELNLHTRLRHRVVDDKGGRDG